MAIGWLQPPKTSAEFSQCNVGNESVQGNNGGLQQNKPPQSDRCRLPASGKPVTKRTQIKATREATEEQQRDRKGFRSVRLFTWLRPDESCRLNWDSGGSTGDSPGFAEMGG